MKPAMINLPPYPKEEDIQWSGYTLDQIRMRRALVQARMEIQKFKLSAAVDQCKQKSPLLSGRSSILSRVAGAFTVAEYAFFAIRLFRMAAPVFRRKK